MKQSVITFLILVLSLAWSQAQVIEIDADFEDWVQ